MDILVTVRQVVTFSPFFKLLFYIHDLETSESEDEQLSVSFIYWCLSDLYLLVSVNIYTFDFFT